MHETESAPPKTVCDRHAPLGQQILDSDAPKVRIRKSKPKKPTRDGEEVGRSTKSLGSVQYNTNTSALCAALSFLATSFSALVPVSALLGTCAAFYGQDLDPMVPL